ncbi:GNAT family N-acetyltransferase [Fusibacter ferrireducens]|uniref:GNAT family N-acetyltransferase n=1 Tax=Fusibacter ferrireducens TaxID=2785058 RepID=A0ABR9ZPP2_9FIRM|nr:GNAT family protein [Fusibacter ferrireducens]MBF4692379.1 GNAT family N-acetyltransferase [Fusibacter ferrireducens]
MQMSIILRDLKVEDLEAYFKLNHPDRAFHKFNGPYFKKDTLEGLENYIALLRSKFESGEQNPLDQKKIIADAQTDEIIGTVNWYWKSEETNWMEIGIVIFNEDYWGKGIGKKALSLWIDNVFADHPELVRLGLTTWSGNHRMMKLAEHLGFKKEAVYRKARIVEQEYYDSISYGILKEEWYNNLI